ncbi:MAG: lipid-binding SYLF domain-containing protein [Planctomycetota bacterium]|nr:lipid-binding SYLF domain-containing protein [Planctomycetota bacterium]
MERADGSKTWFEENVVGLDEQIANAKAYVIFPDVAQWGIIFSGGRFGRGALMDPNGDQIGWAAVNTISIGLQAGVQGFRMLFVIQDQATLDEFMENKWTGNVDAVVVAGDAGGTAVQSFEQGIALYTGASQGLMAGISLGLEYIRFKDLDEP